MDRDDCYIIKCAITYFAYLSIIFYLCVASGRLGKNLAWKVVMY